MRNPDERSDVELATILLIQAVDYDSRALVGFQPLCTPVSIATIAALTSDEFIVDLWDENLEGLIDEHTILPRPKYDIVGISTLFEEVGQRVPTLAALFRQRGSYICAGGPGISNQIGAIRECVDSTFVNEAEYTWPQFLRQWLAGTAEREYVQIAKPDLADSPPPRWGRLSDKIATYRVGGVQTTRGCPFDCEFCDVIYLYGRAQRHKPIANVLTEIINLQLLGSNRIFFTDDEFVGDPKYARALLQQLIPLNNSFAGAMAYNTQLTLNVSYHEDMLQQLADANFSHVLIGIESFNEASLQETNKLQNCRRDIESDCRKILSYAIGINGSFIVGFDSDGPDVFDRIVSGVNKACIPFASVSILRPTYGTKLWTRLRETRSLWRLRTADQLPQPLRMDILPRGSLSRAEIIEGRIYVNKELSRVGNLCGRLNGWVSLISRIPNIRNAPFIGVDAAIKIVREHPAITLTPPEYSLLAETLAHAREVAPIMVGRVLDAILAQLLWYRIRTFHTEEELKGVLAAEQAGDLVSDERPVRIPSAFAAAFRKHLFPLVYWRLHRNLEDDTLIPGAASEVFVDFLVRLSADGSAVAGDTFFNAHHDEFLRLLCDRTAARITGRAPSEVGAIQHPSALLKSGLKRSGIFDAVLKEVGDRVQRLGERQSRLPLI